MGLGLLLLILVGLALAVAFIHVVSKMASEREIAARRMRNGIRPFSDNTSTHFGHS